MRAINIHLPDKLYKRLDDLAKKTGRTPTYCVECAIIEYIDALEDTDFALRALEEHHQSGGKVYTLAEVKSILNL